MKFLNFSLIHDYSPFGMLLPNTNIDPNTGVLLADGDYRYGFQGQEKDDEIKGEGNSVNYKYRMHDPRIGRFFAVDPLSDTYPFWSPYAFSGNQVIHSVEIEGLEVEVNLNYKDASFKITRDEKNRLSVTSSDLTNINLAAGKNVSGFGARSSTNFKEPGGTFNVFCSDCFTTNGKGTTVYIVLPTKDVIRKCNDYLSMGVKVTTEAGNVILVDDYNDVSKELALEGAYKRVSELSGEVKDKPNSAITKINIYVNGFRSTPEENAVYKSKIEEKYKDSDVEVNFSESGGTATELFILEVEYETKVVTPAVEVKWEE